MKYLVTVHGRELQIEVTSSGVTVDGAPVGAELTRLDHGPVHSLLLDGASRRVVARHEGAGRWEVQIGADPLIVDVIDERTRAIREMSGAGAVSSGPSTLHAPMPGMVLRVDVSKGDRVTAGDGVAIVEAMKMENTLAAPADGVVTRVLVAAGEAVEKDQPLVEFGAVDEDES